MTATVWMAVGFLGQLMFSARFVLQWLSSEREGRSIFPNAFWHLSIAGGATLLAYALYVRDPVFIAGQGLGLAIYLRNLQLIRGTRRAAAEAN